MSADARSLGTTFSSRARDAFLLESAERTVRALTPDQQAAVRKQFDAAQRRASVADDLSDERNIAVAFVLYRDAICLLAGAIFVSRDSGAVTSDLPIGSAIAKLDSLVAAGALPAPPQEFAAVKEILLADGALAFDRADAQALLALRGQVEATVRWLSTLVEPRTVREIQTTRVLRIAAGVFVGLASLTFIGYRLTRPVNIALHMPVTVSERHPASTAPADNSGLTNGEIEATYGIQTTHPASGLAWAAVDLLKPVKIGTVKVFNRADGYFTEGQPFTLEFSEDGTNYVAVDKRAEAFSSWSPWVYNANGATARFVRVSSANYVALTEIEISPKR